MFCRNCGKEIPTDAKFCSFCGGATTELPPNSIQNQIKSTVKVDNRRLLHYLSMITSAVIILLTFSKWINIESRLGGGNLGVFGLFNLLEKISKYGDIASFYFLDFMYGITVCITCVICITYIVKVYRSETNSAQGVDYHWGISAMMVLIVIYCVFYFVAMVILSPVENSFLVIALSGKFYVAFALLLLNRFVLLPKIKNERCSSKSHILYENEWLCEKCKCKNNLKDDFCKYCGQHR